MIILHPRIHTLNPLHTSSENPWGTVGALRIEQDRITMLGTPEQVLAHRSVGEPVWKADAACLFPGIIDSHAHLSSLGMRPGAIDLPDDTPPKGWMEAVRSRTSSLSPGQWITGRGWNQSTWPRGGFGMDARGFPTRELLDKVSPHNPVILKRVDHHAIWVNSAALRATGLLSGVSCPEGGAIHYLEDGSLSGVFIDEACSLVEDRMPPITSEENQTLIAERSSLFLEQGITNVHCALVPPDQIRDYAQISRSEVPTPRIRGMIYARAPELAVWASENPFLAGKPDDMWSIMGLKAFADGALGSRGAWMLSPYLGTEETGICVTSPQDLTKLAKAALASNWPLATHAIGDRAVREVIVSYKNAGWTSRRSKDLCWRVEHTQHTTAEDLDLMASLGLATGMQPIHCTQDMRMVEPLLGAERAAWSYPWREVQDRGIALGFGSDYPIETLNPFHGIHAALTRRNAAGLPHQGWFPEQCLNREETLKAYTTGAAALCVGDQGLGKLHEIADLIALDTDPTEASPKDIRNARALWTMVGGKVLHGEMQ